MIKFCTVAERVPDDYIIDSIIEGIEEPNQHEQTINVNLSNLRAYHEHTESKITNQICTNVLYVDREIRKDLKENHIFLVIILILLTIMHVSLFVANEKRINELEERVASMEVMIYDNENKDSTDGRYQET